MADSGATSNSEQPVVITLRDAACVVLMDRSGAEPVFLLGRRRASQVFLPNMWVFPGGRVDDADHDYARALQAASAPRSIGPLAFAVAAIRELYEEAGIALGEPSLSADRDLPSWGVFSAMGLTPSLGWLKPLARAITPPGRPRRFDTWFFIADRSHVLDVAVEPDGELLDLGWFTISEMRGLDLPVITRKIVDDVASHLEGLGTAAAGDHIPFYYQDVDVYRRVLIDPAVPPSKP